MRVLSAVVCSLVTFAGQCLAEQQEYKGVCEASAAVVLDDNFFAVASDETNVVVAYKKGKPDPVRSFNFESFTTFDKSDLEGGARIGSRIYWISSHSLNKEGKDRAKRKIIFATDIKVEEGEPNLVPVGKPYLQLRDALTAAAGVSKGEFNIEGLASTEAGALLIGLRGPLNAKGEAIIVELSNPSDVVENSAAPKLSKQIPLFLDRLGIRSIDRVGGSGERQFIITAGPVDDAGAPFRLFWWSGQEKDPPSEIKDVTLDGLGLKPEALLAFRGEAAVHVVSDDGDLCSDEGPKEQRKFRTQVFSIKPKS